MGLRRGLRVVRAGAASHGSEGAVKPYFDDGQCVIYHGDAREVRLWWYADVLVTDPPYGMSYKSGWQARQS